MEGFLGVIIWIIIIIAAGVSKSRKAQQKRQNNLPQERRTVQRPVLQDDPWAELKKILGDEEKPLPQKRVSASPQRDPEWYADEGFGQDLQGTEGYIGEIMEGAVDPPNTMPGSLEGQCTEGEIHQHGSIVTSRLNVAQEERKEERKEEKAKEKKAAPSKGLPTFSSDSLAQAVIWAEIIGEPLARRPRGVHPRFR